MGLQAGDDLQLVLDVAQEQVCVGQFARAFRRQIAERIELLERADGLLGSKPGIASTVNQRQRLHDEFELADSAAAELDVALDHRGRFQLRLDLPLHRAQLAQRVEIQVAAKHKVIQLREQLMPDFERASGRPRAQQGRPFPRLSEALVIVDRTFNRRHQRRGTAAGPKPQIDPKASRR